MSLATTSLLSQVRSLNIFGNCGIPKLSDFKFMRLLFVEVGDLNTAIDLTGINRLSQLRYLKVQGSSREAVVLLPAEIRGLRFLETLDLSGIVNSCGLRELVDVPRLSHVSAPWFEGWGLPDGIGKTGESPFALYCGDAILGSSFSPTFVNIERLYLGMLILSSVPRWIGHLCCLRDLALVAKQIHQEDFNIIGTRLTSLVRLRLRIVHVPTERIVIEGSTGFKVLKLFVFDCDGLSRLTFEAGAMPDLWELKLTLNPYEWDKTTPIGLQHLPSLKIIDVSKTKFHDKLIFQDDDEDIDMIRRVFQEAADALPARPALHVSPRGHWQSRPEEST
ncbi:hypothetical protein EJB05_45004, partial [Eragrostis curvula]